MIDWDALVEQLGLPTDQGSSEAGRLLAIELLGEEVILSATRHAARGGHEPVRSLLVHLRPRATVEFCLRELLAASEFEPELVSLLAAVAQARDLDVVDALMAAGRDVAAARVLQGIAYQGGREDEVVRLVAALRARGTALNARDREQLMHLLDTAASVVEMP